MARPWMRAYATQEQTTQTESEKPGEQSGSSSSEPSAEKKELQQCQEKLKAKEQETVDLTVRRVTLRVFITFAYEVYNIGTSAIPPS